jgi:hypothetical protein
MLIMSSAVWALLESRHTSSVDSGLMMTGSLSVAQLRAGVDSGR